jgi:hypothetical protein
VLRLRLARGYPRQTPSGVRRHDASRPYTELRLPLEKPDLHNRRSATCGQDTNPARLPERQDRKRAWNQKKHDASQRHVHNRDKMNLKFFIPNDIRFSMVMQCNNKKLKI